MAEAKFSIGQVSLTGYLRIIAREVSDPVTEVANIVFAPPHPTTRNIIVPDLNPVMHIFEFYESADGIALGILLATFSIDVGKLFQSALTIYEFVVDRGEPGDPNSGDTTWFNEAIKDISGEDKIVYYERGLGPLSFRDEVETVPEGGIKFKGAKVFMSQQKWFVMVANDTTVNTTIVSKNVYKGFVQITADTLLSATHFNAMLEINGPSGVLELTMPAMSDIPNGTIIGFNTHQGSQHYTQLNFPAGVTCRFLNEAKDKLWLAKGEELTLYKHSATAFKALWPSGDFLRIGETVKGNIKPLNGIAKTGAWYAFDELPRVFYWYVNKIPTLHLATAADISAGDFTQMAKFAIDSPNSRFWMPDTGGYFERNVDPDGNVDTDRGVLDRFTGIKQDDEIKSHTHPFDPLDHPGQSDNADDRDVMLPGSGGSKTTGATGGSETRPKNVSINSWLII